ncbi:chemotaxis protein CheW [Patescibacteria group bacterium]|nr:chemotaxis protein CheW [Patescibacteria group bacterium]
MERKYLTFEMSGQIIALWVLQIKEISDMQNIHLVPNAGDGLLGVFALRGRNIPVFEFRTGEPRISECIIVIKVDAPNLHSFALIVDRPEEVLSIPDDLPRSPIEEKTLRQAVTPACQGIKYQVSHDDRQFWLMDPENILSKEQLARAASLL